MTLRRGALLKRHRNAPRPPAKSCPAFLAFLRRLPCAIEGCNGEPVEAAHVDFAGDKGMSSKVADKFAIPLCGGPAGHHSAQHRHGWQTFQRMHKLDALSAAGGYWHAWPGRSAFERKLEAANG